MRQARTMLLVFFLFLLFLLTGCGNSNQIPDPPHIKTDLVIELLSALKNNNYQLAEKKMKRLEAIDSNNIFFGNIRITIQNNRLISRAQGLLNLGDVDGAIELLNERISVEGQNSSLAGALNQLETLKDIKQVTDDILEAESSKEIAISSGKLNRIISSYPSAKVLSDFSNSRLNNARSLLIVERALAVEDLRADIDISWVKGRSYLDTMIASLEAEDPKNPEVLAYKQAMQENWMSENVLETYCDPEKETLFFRKGLLLKKNVTRENIYNVLLSSPPNNYRSLLIKAMLLKFAGYSKESSAFTKQVSEAVAASSSRERSWYQLVPDNLIEINKINPFVLYPFFIYHVR